MRNAINNWSHYLVCLGALALVLSKSSFGQHAADSIQIRKFNGSEIFVYKGKKVNMNDLMLITQNNSEASALMQSAKTKLNIGTALGSAGGFMMGYPLGSALAGGEMNWAIFGAGAAITVVAVGIGVKSKKTAKRAVTIYNEGLGTACSDSLLWFGLNPRGLTFAVSF